MRSWGSKRRSSGGDQERFVLFEVSCGEQLCPMPASHSPDWVLRARKTPFPSILINELSIINEYIIYIINEIG